MSVPPLAVLSSLSPKEMERHARNVAPGDWAVEHARPIATLLGSCVSVCLFDLELRLGGINHFMLPALSRSAFSETDALLAGDYCMEALLNGLLMRGARKSRIKAKAFGGGAILKLGHGQNDIGRRNADFTREWLGRENIPLMSDDMLGPWSRKLVFTPWNGEAWCRRMASTLHTSVEIMREEKIYAASLQKDGGTGAKGVELF
ncbi:MAG: chemotaxis protein CheD [Rhodocyclaceae bacterium]|nr:chemotaxis protein CheD [Rhodocyclaceae bacterium]MBX3668784.1 chemotaxis protein CheD [Rhodocyclaceae bacterium]